MSTTEVYDSFDVWMMSNLAGIQGWVSNGPLDEHPAWVTYRRLKDAAVAEAIAKERARWQTSLGHDTPEAAWTYVNQKRAEQDAKIAYLKREYTQWANRWLSLLLDWLAESDARVHAMREELEKLLAALDKPRTPKGDSHGRTEA